MTAEISDKPPLLSLSGIKVEYPAWNRTFVAVENIDLVVRRGEILGLVGESGAGKSTIGSAIMGLLDQPGRITAGTIKLDGEVLDPPMSGACARSAARAFR